jgi:hypothetical protein
LIDVEHTKQSLMRIFSNVAVRARWPVNWYGPQGEAPKDHIGYEIRRLAHWATFKFMAGWGFLVTAAVWSRPAKTLGSPLVAPCMAWVQEAAEAVQP